MLIGLAGKFGAGKDAVGDVLVERFGFKKLSFAEPLREECSDHIKSFPYNIDILTPIDWELVNERIKPHQVWEKPTHPLIRQLLQWWGTDYRRAQDPDYWVKRTAAYLTAHEHDDIVITDARFPNEAALVKQYGKLWLIHRPGQKLTEYHAHVSEAFVDSYSDWDLTVYNDSDLAALNRRITAIMRCELELARIAQERLTATTDSHRLGLTLGECDWIAERSLIAALATTQYTQPNTESNPVNDLAFDLHTPISSLSDL